MKHTIGSALLALRPGEEWTLDGDDYTGLTWLSSEQQPTKQEIFDKIAELDAAEPMKLLREERNKKRFQSVIGEYYQTKHRLMIG